MDYLVSGNAPNVAEAVVPHVVSGGVAVPQSAANPAAVDLTGDSADDIATIAAAAENTDPIGSTVFSTTTPASVTSTAAQVVAANPSRRRIKVRVKTGGNEVRIGGNNSITTNLGISIVPGDPWFPIEDYLGPIFAITATTATLEIAEW